MRVTSCRALWGGLVAVALAAGACAPSLSAINTGAAMTDKDLAMGWVLGANADTDGFAEQFVVRTELPDGAGFSARLQISNLANQDGRAQLSVRVTFKDGSALAYTAKADRGEWEADKERFAVKVGSARIEVTVGKVTVQVDEEDYQIGFTLTSSLAPLRPPGGRFSRGGAAYVTTISIPRGAAHLVVDAKSRDVLTPPPEGAAPVEATPAPGEPTSAEVPAEPVSEGPGGPDGDDTPPPPPEDGPLHVELDGIGYAEDRWGNVPPYDLAKRWEQVLVIGPDETLVLSVFERPSNAPLVAGKSGDVHGWFLVATDDALRVYEPELEVRLRGLVTDPDTGYPLPQLVFVSDPGQRTFRGVVKLGPLSERKDDLGRLSKLERLIARKFTKPWTFRYDRARWLFRKQAPGTEALDVRGAGRFQHQQLNP